MYSPNRVLVGVELTAQCDLRCKHCLRENRSDEVAFDLGLFREVVSQARELGNPHFAFSGGEPTLHPELASFFQVLADSGYHCHLVTNGNRFPRLYDMFMKYKETITGLSISLDGADAQTHDFNRGHGSFRSASMAIAMAVHGGFHVTVQCAVGSHNKHQLVELALLCRDLGVSMLLFTHVFPVPRAVANQLPVDLGEWGDIEDTIESLIYDGPLPVGLSTGHRDPVALGHCETLRHTSYNIDCKGRLTFCCQLSGTSGDGQARDVVADLNQVPLMEAIDRHIAMASETIRDRLRHRAAHPEDPDRDIHCHFCFNRFGKYAGLGDVNG